MSEPTAAPPAAPTTTPGAAATAAQAPKTAASTPATGETKPEAPAKTAAPHADAYAEIDRLAAEPEPEKKTRRPKGSSESAAQTAEGKPTTTTGESAPEKQDSGSAETASKSFSDQPVKIPELRTAYDGLKKKLTETEGRLRQLESGFESHPERKKLLEQLESQATRLKGLQEELRYAAFERSEEYKDQFEKPFVQAYEAGRAKIATLKIQTEDGQTRQATPEDFDAIMRIGDDDQAAQLAESVFGPAKSTIVLYHRERVMELNRRRLAAVEDYRAKAGEREKQQQEKLTLEKAEGEKRNGELAKMFHSLNSEAVEKRPQWFKPVEGDERSAEVLKRGLALADYLFGALPQEQYELLPEAVRADMKDGKLSREGLVRLHSAIRNKAGAFDHVAYLLTKATARVRELEDALSKYEESEPGAGDGRPEKGEKPLSIEDEINQLAARNQ